MFCFGLALGVLVAHCTPPAAAPTGKAPYCDVIAQAGGNKKPSRRDTTETQEHMKKLNAAHNAICGPS